LLRGGQWHSLRARPLNGETLALADILNQERLLLGLEPGNETVHLHATAGVALDTGDLRVERMPRGGATMEPSRAC
jgi:hypothetical protein